MIDPHSRYYRILGLTPFSWLFWAVNAVGVADIAAALLAPDGAVSSVAWWVSTVAYIVVMGFIPWIWPWPGDEPEPLIR